MNIQDLYTLASSEAVYHNPEGSTKILDWSPCPLRLSHLEISSLMQDERFQQYAVVYPGPNGSLLVVFGYPIECIECSDYRPMI